MLYLLQVATVGVAPVVVTTSESRVTSPGPDKCHDTGTRPNVKETEETGQLVAGINHDQKSDDASSFFQSLQLHSIKQQTSGTVEMEADKMTGQKEKLEDLSFFDSIGLYWVNPADKNDVKVSREEQEIVSEAQNKPSEKNVETDIDEFDFLNVLGLTPVVGSNKKWRLWNPEIDASGWDEDMLYRDLDLPDHQDHHQYATDPTIIEHLSPTAVSRQRNISQVQVPQEQVLSNNDEVSDPLVELNVNTRPVRNIKKTKLFDPAPPTKKLRTINGNGHDNILGSSNITETEAVIPKTLSSKLLECPSCKAQVSRHQYGKHLVSHYHYHRSLGHPDTNSIILDNIQDIVHQSPFQCHLCQFYCNWHLDFFNHIKNHSEETAETTFWCQICMKVIDGNKKLIQHLQSYNHTELVTVINRSVPVIIKKVDLVSCKLCNLKFRFNISLKKHMKYSHGVDNFQLENHEKYHCSYCSYFSYKKSSLKTHTFLVHPNPKLKYDCYICKQQFVSKESALNHRNSIAHKMNAELHKAVENESNCSLCSESFPDNEDLTKHLESAHHEDLPQCHLCGGLFHFHQELTLHLKLKCQTSIPVSSPVSDDNNRQYKCTLCSFSASRESLLNLHLSCRHQHHQDDTTETTVTSLTPCPVCNVSIRQEHVEDHIRCHSTEMFYCQTCNKLFGSKEKFLKHCKSCNVEHQCSQCKYKGSSKILLNLHVKRQHSTVKIVESSPVFNCHLCESQFTVQSSLKKHIRSEHQENEPRFHCISCDFKCHFKSDLDRHQMKHTNQKNIKCPDCNFVCKRNNELARHNKLVHQNTPYRNCNLCSYKTKSLDHFKRHMNAKHHLNELSYFEIQLDENDFIVTKSSDTNIPHVPEFITEQIVIDQ